MQGIEKKIIRASAGTGKTYRLSLEYIGLLLKYHAAGVHFSEILVITFTRKATAEIRQRIFEHLAEIVYDKSGKRSELEENLKAVTGIEVGEAERDVLRKNYVQMIANKNQVQISTIDSFTNQVFKTMIGPFLGIMDYEITPTNDESVLAEIYQTMLTPQNLKSLQDFYFRTGKRQISDFKELVNSIIDDRLIFDLMGEIHEDGSHDSNADALYQEFRKNFDEVLARLQEYINSDVKKRNRSVKDLLNKAFYQKIFRNPETTPAAEIAYKVKEKLTDKDFLRENFSVLLTKPGKINFWNGSKLYRKNVDAEEKDRQLSQLEIALRYFADWILAEAGAREANEVRAIAKEIFKKYDELKFRDKKFTYNDLSYYTFKYLYNPSLSLIEDGAVSNQFFEYLTAKIRFVLIDEFQDTSVIQYKILYPMIREVISGSGIKDYGGVIVVGDEKQSIYGWRGGERDLLLNLDHALQGAATASLNTSYRSEWQIIDFVNGLFGNNNLQETLQRYKINWHYEMISGNKKEKRGYVNARFSNISASATGREETAPKWQSHRRFLVETILPLIEAGKLSLSGTAILARKNSDLDFAASVLNEFGVPYISESSLSVLQHAAIRPLFYFYQFLVYRDIYDLLSFLRSDYVLMPANELREFIDIFRDNTKKDLTALLQNATHLSTIRYFVQFLENIDYLKSEKLAPSLKPGNGILSLTKKLLEHYGVIHIFGQENDLKNIHLFFEIIALFENDRQAYTHDLRGFLQFCEDLEKDESFKQAGLETVEAIRLLTIHKAKGLEFDNVILLWDLGGKSGHAHGNIKFYPKFSPDYHNLQDFVLTYNFDKAVAFSSKRGLFEDAKVREAIEVLNLFYVATTRAKANLFIFFTFQKKEGLARFFADMDSDDQLRVDRLLGKCVQSILPEKAEDSENENNDWFGEIGNLAIEQKKTEQEKDSLKNWEHVSQFITFEPFDKFVPVADETVRMSRAELIRRFVYDRSAVKGDIAHYYLSFIKYDSPRAREFARVRSLMKYGGLLPRQMIDHILERVNEFLAENKNYFSRQNWDQVFTEVTIFPESSIESDAGYDAQLRIDRMMVSQAKRLVMILDYKSGEVWHEEQIEIYKQAVKKLPVVRTQGYRVEAKYVKIDLL